MTTDVDTAPAEAPESAAAASGAHEAAKALEAGRPRGVPLLPKGTATLATLLVAMADAMVLGGLMAAWFLIKGGTPAWPPDGVAIDTYFATTYTITATLSSFAAAWAVSASRRNDQRSTGVAVVLAVLLGLAQLNLVWYAISQAGFGVTDHAFGTLYFLLLGYTLLHVGIAVIALTIAGARAVAGQLGYRAHDPIRAAGVLWHYSTLAWSVIVIAVFVFSPHG